jgi:16S rRNA C967 or C1407 C5-methylase (RsmB/RsmF family)
MKKLSKNKQKAHEKQAAKVESAASAMTQFFTNQYGADRWPRLLEAMRQPVRHCCMPNRFANVEAVEQSLQPLATRLRRVSFLRTPCFVVVDDDNDHDDDRQTTYEHELDNNEELLDDSVKDKGSNNSNKKSNQKHAAASSASTIRLPFAPPVKDPSTNLYNYYLLDVASVIGAEALQVQPHDHVLDMCAAPGGKSLVLCQHLELAIGAATTSSSSSLTTVTSNNSTSSDVKKKKSTGIGSLLLPTMASVGSLVANELANERRLRLKTALRNYLPEAALKSVKVTNYDATEWKEQSRYDRVLLDAPCSSERHVIHDDEQLVQWTPNRTKKNAHRQVQLLRSALRAVKLGGTVVYITCSISDTENDAVVHQVLVTDHERARRRRRNQRRRQEREEDDQEEDDDDDEEEEEGNEDDEDDGSEEEDDEDDNEINARVIERTLPLGEKTRYGWIILPDTSEGFGPLYICVLQRTASKSAV